MSGKRKLALLMVLILICCSAACKRQEKEEQKKVRHEEDLTLIQGIIDVFWIEKDGIVLLDYKTDRVQQAKELIDRYETQLKLYADVLERVFGARKLKVKEILIYSFSLEKLITL